MPRSQRRSGAVSHLSPGVGEPRSGGATEPVLYRRQQVDHLPPLAGARALLRPLQGVPDRFVLGPALSPGLEVIPQIRVVLEEARGAGAQRAGQAHELGLQLLRLVHRVVEAVLAAGKGAPALQLVQLLDATRP